MTRVSVIIPVYNIERHLRQCLDSVAGQTLSELQIICVDDGSSDASWYSCGVCGERQPVSDHHPGERRPGSGPKCRYGTRPGRLFDIPGFG